jgi:hypothetical protein
MLPGGEKLRGGRFWESRLYLATTMVKLGLQGCLLASSRWINGMAQSVQKVMLYAAGGKETT